ncbi:MAG: hypothetical protein WD029_06255, partial [Microthrixaceae bacterium]
MFDPEESEAIPSEAADAQPALSVSAESRRAGSGIGLGCELGVVAQQGAGGLVALANLVAGVGVAGVGVA